MRRYIKVELTPSECCSFILERLKELVVESLEDEILDLNLGEGSEMDSLLEHKLEAEKTTSFAGLLDVMRSSAWDIEPAFRMVLQAIGAEQEQLNEAWLILAESWGPKN